MINLKSFDNILLPFRVENSIEAIAEANHSFKSFWEKLLESNKDVFIVGGFLRDIINNQTFRDIDIIVDMDTTELARLLYYSFNTLRIRTNHFGSFKILVSENITIDIWTINNNWFFTKSISTYQRDDRLRSISKGCFLNIDSLVYSVKDKKGFSKFYDDCVKTKMLDILSTENKYLKLNPSKAAMLIRCYYLSKKYSLFLSPSLKSYLKNIYEYFKTLNLTFEQSIDKTLKQYPKYLIYYNSTDFLEFCKRL